MMRSMIVAVAACATTAAANNVEVVDGQTSVALDTATLAAAASLNLTGVAGPVIAEGNIPGSVAFPINSRDAGEPLLATSFEYDSTDFFGFFAGAIEHEGSVIFNDSIEVGNFTIGFDASRIDQGTGASGFFVASTIGVVAPLFDVVPTGLSAGATGLEISADLIVGPEFAGLLVDLGLAASDLTGADVGDALVQGGLGCTGVDINDSGSVNGRDLRVAVRSFISGADAGDYNGDGVVRFNDLRAFIRDWFSCVYR